ncbi:non-ribosomal peptide synthetase [Actinocrispum wychmicini]|uniref:Amino acid adenylation domain-containing protein n=1 Tax=Actinocrispum wychmicini TaxID=1213861 RepID=A0A4R2IK25_9PSEU|nr:non-ribosomal peptide synthetase [Actinocrispum wychmicini]TCO45313.1 amino acid adenylation domain-containing protein [Actinocrispum wychmicini]
MPGSPQEFPASFAQERLWFVTQLAPDVGTYNVLCATMMPHGTDPGRFADGLAKLVDRHEPLRTSFTVHDGHLMQVIHPRVPIEIVTTDLRDLPYDDIEPRIDQIVAQDNSDVFDLERAPLWRVRAMHLTDSSWAVAFVLHHTVCDGQSGAILLEDFVALCRGEDLPALPIQYVDFAAWQRDQYDAGAMAGQLGYWRQRLAGIPPEIALPTDRARPQAPSHRGGQVETELPEADFAAVKRLARAEGTTTYAVLLAAFAAVLYRLSGQSDVVVGCPVAGRELPELERLVGMFVNSVALRVDCDGTPTFRELIGRATETVQYALDNSSVPFDRVVEEVAPDRDPSVPPLYQVVLNLLPVDMGPRPPLSNGTSKVDLLVDMSEYQKSVLHGRWEYSTDLFDPATVRAIADRYVQLLSAAVAAPDTPLNRLPLLLEDERDRLLAAPITLSVEDTVLSRFGRFAEGVAVCDSAGGRLTYPELRARAGALAHRLVAAGVRPGQPVAVIFGNTVDLAVAVFGVLMAGGAYLPLDVEHPPDRIRFLLKDSGAAAVVAAEPIECAVPVLTLGPDDRAAPPDVLVWSDSLAYVVYTSGSTGRPKGVGVTHGNVTAYLDGLAGLVDLDRPVWTMLQPLTFDFAVTAFFGALLTGGTLHLVSKDLATDADWIAGHLRDVDYLKITPSHLAALESADIVPRKALILGGEASQVDDVRLLRKRGNVVNHYGPTETTVGVLALPADRDSQPRGEVTPLGWPMAHAEAYIVDDWGELVPEGVAGELVIGGATVTRGYLGQPGLTAEKFVPDQFSGRPGARLYRTGDLARRLPDGAIEFLGRADDQVKVRGYRVEPGEVRAVLAAYPGVTGCAVIGVDGELVAYVTPEGLDLAALRRHAEATLPGYMVPGLLALDSLPLTPHGKLDRSRLPAVDRPQTVAEGPRGEFEEIIAGLFAALLGRDQVGRTDDFIALGGHSLLAIQLANRIRKAFGVTLPLPVVFSEPTVAHLAAAVTARLNAGQLPPIEPAPAGEPRLASYGEQRLWFVDQLNPGATLHNVQFRRRLTGELDPKALRLALLEIVRRHEVWRSRFVATPSGLVRVVQPEPELPFDTVDLSGADEARRWEVLAESGGARFDLAAQPPLRALLIRLGPAVHELLLTVHHAVFDGPSVEVLTDELARLYPALRDGREPDLPDLPVRYSDFAAWQRKVVTEVGGEQLGYWRRRLEGTRTLALPTDRPRPSQLGVEGAHELFEVPAAVVDALRAAGASEGGSLFMASLACYAEWLRRRTGQRDIAVGVPVITRQRPELEPLIGFFVNTLVIRVDVTGQESFRELTRQVRQLTIDAYTHADVPFEALVDELTTVRDPAQTPLVQTMFMLADDRRALPVDMGGVSMEFEPWGTLEAKYDVSMYLWRRPDGLMCVAEYRPELFDKSTMREFVTGYTALLAGAAAQPDVALGDIDAG